MSSGVTYDWTTFDVHMDIATDADIAYDHWATARGMESFFTREFRYSSPDGQPRGPEERAQPDDSYWLAFHHPSELRGTVLTAEPAKRFAFTFGDMRVDVAFVQCDRGVRIRLTQSNIPTDDTGRAQSHMNCRSCWVYYLLNLRSVIEHGHDLRDAGLPDNPVSIHFGERAAEALA